MNKYIDIYEINFKLVVSLDQLKDKPTRKYLNVASKMGSFPTLQGLA